VFLAVDHPTRSLRSRACLHRRHVGPGLGFGHGERGHQPAGDDPVEPPCALRIGCREDERGAAERLQREHRVGKRAGGGHLLACQAQRAQVSGSDRAIQPCVSHDPEHRSRLTARVLIGRGLWALCQCGIAEPGQLRGQLDVGRIQERADRLHAVEACDAANHQRNLGGRLATNAS
jgi:hypothetical protein